MKAKARHRAVRGVFDDWAARGRDKGMEDGHLPAVRDTLDAWAWRPVDTFLDVGCGNGYAVRLAARRAPEGLAVGLDLSPAMVARARELSRGLDRVHFFNAPLEGAPFRDARFDKIFSMETLYYLPDMAAAFRRLRGLLRPGGDLAVLVDFYGENREVHHWPEQVGAPMTLIGEAEYRDLAVEAGLTDVATDRIRQEGTGDWRETAGTLRLRARR